MAKSKSTKPLLPLKREFYASLHRYVAETENLANLCEHILKINVLSDEVAGMLQERVEAFNAARFSDE